MAGNRVRQLDIFQWQTLLAVVIISAVPPLLSLLSYLINGDMGNGLPFNLEYLVTSFLYSFAITASLFFGCAVIINLLNLKLPWKGNVVKRIIIEALVIFTYTTLAQILIITLFFRYLPYEGMELTTKIYYANIMFGNTITLIVTLVIEGIFFFREWKESLVAKERLEKENIQSQFANLRAQLDPHFMFNSLNVLSSLIRKNPAKAEAFVDDFARVYRYVLDVKDEMVIPLKKELEFANAYLSLQQLRFGEGLQVKKNINGSQLNQYITPLSLQEMINNAVKHNEISVEKPLNIKIRSSGTGVLVSNNLQPRNEGVISTGVGLENLRQRYQLLSEEEPRFEVRDQEYVAWIPLISED